MFVIVTGLAGAGKTSVGEPLARVLELPFISKDAIKEALFDAVGFGGWAWSKTLSRAADAALIQVAQGLDGAVLDSFWRAETAADLLAPLSSPMVEVFCRCTPDVARQRFYNRVRHPGHADDEAAEPERDRSYFSHELPLRTLGPVVEVDTETSVDIESVAGQVLAATKEPGASAGAR